jgi:hypothetical protein
MSSESSNNVYIKNGPKLTFHSVSPQVKEILDAWLKYGTVFLIYRLCTYYFIPCENDKTIFTSESLRLVLFILLGFTIYYAIVKPYVPVNMHHPIFRNIINDTLMFGTVLASMHVFEYIASPDDYLLESDWLKNSGFILLAFAAYRVFIDPFIPKGSISPKLRPVVQDWTQFGSFLVFFRLLQGKSIVDQKWITSVLFALLGFTGYHFVTKKLIRLN